MGMHRRLTVVEAVDAAVALTGLASVLSAATAFAWWRSHRRR
jgi:hypothetical protein